MDEVFSPIQFLVVLEEEFAPNLLVVLRVSRKQHAMYHNNRNNDHGNTCYSLEKSSKMISKKKPIFSFILPGDVKNVFANSSVARSRISRVICTNRPITGGTR